MKLKNKEMSNYLSALNRISSKTTGKLGYAVARNIRKISDAVLEYENIRNGLINKYGEIDDNGQKVIHINTNAFNKFAEEIQEYQDIEHEVEIFKISEIEIWNSNLNAQEIISIDFMINETTD